MQKRKEPSFKKGAKTKSNPQISAKERKIRVVSPVSQDKTADLGKEQIPIPKELSLETIFNPEFIPTRDLFPIPSESSKPKLKLPPIPSDLKSILTSKRISEEDYYHQKTALETLGYATGRYHAALKIKRCTKSAINSVITHHNDLVSKGFDHEDIFTIASFARGGESLNTLAIEYVKLTSAGFSPQQLTKVVKTDGGCKNLLKLIEILDKDSTRLLSHFTDRADLIAISSKNGSSANLELVSTHLDDIIKYNIPPKTIANLLTKNKITKARNDFLNLIEKNKQQATLTASDTTLQPSFAPLTTLPPYVSSPITPTLTPQTSLPTIDAFSTYLHYLMAGMTPAFTLPVFYPSLASSAPVSSMPYPTTTWPNTLSTPTLAATSPESQPITLPTNSSLATTPRAATPSTLAYSQNSTFFSKHPIDQKQPPLTTSSSTLPTKPAPIKQPNPKD